jgi:ribA/ribD-fused uncharacterized protein
MLYSVEWLKTQIELQFHPEYLFFWGHTPRKPGIIDKSCFSQWYASTFIVNGIVYQTAEHWMMAGKASLFNDSDSLENILSADKPAEAKSIGRLVKNFDPEIWSASSYAIVVEGNRHKFLQHEALQNFLLQTGDKIIVEASPADPIWGIGLPQDNKEAKNPFQWRGTNLLGFALMEVRDFLRSDLK